MTEEIKHVTKIWLHQLEKSMPKGMHSGRSRFMYPILHEWAQKLGMRAEAANTSNAIQLYLNSYDPRLLFEPANYTGALWMGYSPDDFTYLRSHDAATQTWFVPFHQALPSLTHFLGRIGEEYQPRISTMLRGKEIGEMFYNAYNHDIKLKTDASQVGIGLWLDYDGNQRYREMVLNFIRILQPVLRDLKMHENFAFWLYSTSSAPLSKDEMSMFIKNDNIHVVNNPLNIMAGCSYYISLDRNATSVDPLAVVLAENISATRIIAPPHMDMLGLDFNILPPQLSNCIDALMSRGSPGLESIFETAAKAVVQMFDIQTTRA